MRAGADSSFRVPLEHRTRINGQVATLPRAVWVFRVPLERGIRVDGPVATLRMLGDLTQQSVRGDTEESGWLISALVSVLGSVPSSVPDHAPGSASALPSAPLSVPTSVLSSVLLAVLRAVLRAAVASPAEPSLEPGQSKQRGRSLNWPDANRVDDTFSADPSHCSGELKQQQQDYESPGSRQRKCKDEARKGHEDSPTAKYQNELEGQHFMPQSRRCLEGFQCHTVVEGVCKRWTN